MSDNEKFDVSADWSANAQINQDKYNEWYETSFNNNEDFWNEHGKRIEWMKPYTKVRMFHSTKIIFQSNGMKMVHLMRPPIASIDI